MIRAIISVSVRRAERVVVAIGRSGWSASRCEADAAVLVRVLELRRQSPVGNCRQRPSHLPVHVSAVDGRRAAHAEGGRQIQNGGSPVGGRGRAHGADVGRRSMAPWPSSDGLARGWRSARARLGWRRAGRRRPWARAEWVDVAASCAPCLLSIQRSAVCVELFTQTVCGAGCPQGFSVLLLMWLHGRVDSVCRFHSTGPGSIPTQGTRLPAEPHACHIMRLDSFSDKHRQCRAR